MPYEANPLLRLIRRLAPLHSVREASDGHLLERFVAAKDEAAFEGLMHRHGQMVFAVCRRVLSSPQDVEDAFQATFLVLVQKADSMRKQESISGWLFGVAHKVAARLRQKVAKRVLCEGHPVETLAADTASVGREETARVARCTKCSICSSEIVWFGSKTFVVRRCSITSCNA